MSKPFFTEYYDQLVRLVNADKRYLEEHYDQFQKEKLPRPVREHYESEIAFCDEIVDFLTYWFDKKLGFTD